MCGNNNNNNNNNKQLSRRTDPFELFLLFLTFSVLLVVNPKKLLVLFAEFGRNPVSTHQIQPEYGDEQADAGRNCRNRLARPNLRHERMRTGNFSFSLFS